MAKETFIEYWNKYKKIYKYGHDYIDVDCGRYVAIVSTSFDLISGILFMSHCYSSRLVPFCMFTNAYYFLGEMEYESSHGECPMNVIWNMKYDIPGNILELTMAV